MIFTTHVRTDLDKIYIIYIFIYILSFYICTFHSKIRTGINHPLLDTSSSVYKIFIKIYLVQILNTNQSNAIKEN